MHILDSFNHNSLTFASLALTIGYFDGVHIGHRALLNQLKLSAEHTAVITFSNHPSTVLKKTSISHLTTLEHRLLLFEKMGIDYTFLISFTEDFSRQSAHTFLRLLKKKLGFSHLILGHDAVIGHDRVNNLFDLSQELHFSVEYLAPIYFNEKIVSSSEIRTCINEGKLDEASSLLGRPYSIFAQVQKGKGKGGLIGFHTANLPVEDLALPPFGVYAVEVRINHEILPGVANLGHAPTLHTTRPPCLEVHLIDENRDLYGTDMEVFFLKYLRAEKHFQSIEDLKLQIEKDIQLAKSSFECLSASSISNTV